MAGASTGASGSQPQGRDDNFFPKKYVIVAKATIRFSSYYCEVFILALKTVACPVIEEVNDKTLQYKFVTRDLVGVFHWNLDFDWQEVEREDWRPYESPVMAGGLFTMR